MKTTARFVNSLDQARRDFARTPHAIRLGNIEGRDYFVITECPYEATTEVVEALLDDLERRFLEENGLRKPE